MRKSRLQRLLIISKLILIYKNMFKTISTRSVSSERWRTSAVWQDLTYSGMIG